LYSLVFVFKTKNNVQVQGRDLNPII